MCYMQKSLSSLFLFVSLSFVVATHAFAMDIDEEETNESGYLDYEFTEQSYASASSAASSTALPPVKYFFPSIEQKKSVSSISFSPDGTQIASASEDQTINIWNVESLEVMGVFEDTTEIDTASFSPNGKYISSISNNTIKIWDSRSGKLIRTFEESDGFNSISFFPDGKYMASATNEAVQIWDVESGKLAKTFNNFNSEVASVSTSPLGESIAVTLEDGKIKVLNMAGELKRTIKLEVDFSPPAKFSPYLDFICTSAQWNFHHIRLSSVELIRTA